MVDSFMPTVLDLDKAILSEVAFISDGRFDARKVVTIDYTNYNGLRTTRRMVPIHVWFGVNNYHTGPQWFVSAYCLERMALRVFAMKAIHSWS